MMALLKKEESLLFLLLLLEIEVEVVVVVPAAASKHELIIVQVLQLLRALLRLLRWRWIAQQLVTFQKFRFSILK